nr:MULTISPECIES: hypothetical protein [unclassified Haladaptatus]
MSSVVSTAADGDDAARTDPFAGARIEVDDAELRALSPSAWLAGFKARLDDLATRLTYGK